MRIPIPFSLSVLLSLPFLAKAQDTIEPKTSLQDAEKKRPEITPAVLIKRVAPEYPKKAKKEHVEGTVRVHAIIAKDGSVKNLKVISGDPLLVEAALEAARQWRYQPMQMNGKPAEVDTTIDVIFALHKTP
jgi:TonB family protein